MNNECEFDFYHHLRDTLLLLGAPSDIADLVHLSKDHSITESAVERLRRYNCAQIDAVKGRLADLNRMKVKVCPPTTD